VPEDRIPVSKPKVELKELYRHDDRATGGAFTIRYRTKFSKVFEREESQARGVVWYQVVQR